MSCKYCDIKMRPLDKDMGVLKGESWKDKFGEGGYIGQSYNDKFHIVVYYDAGCACTDVPDVKFCPFCGEELKMPAEPLIKDAGMREVLRLWAKVNLIPSNATTIEYQLAETLTGTETEFWDNNLHIMFYGNIAPNAVHGKIYTIAELCGEEEE